MSNHLLPRTRPGWVILLALIAVAVALEIRLSPDPEKWLGAGALMFMAASPVIPFAEAWRADVWRWSRPPSHLNGDRLPDLLLWHLRRPFRKHSRAVEDRPEIGPNALRGALPANELREAVRVNELSTRGNT